MTPSERGSGLNAGDSAVIDTSRTQRRQSVRADDAAPEVSVIVPFYGNAIEQLQRGMASVQCSRRTEIIVVDDASVAGPRQADLPISDLHLLRVIRLPQNQGPGVARNVGMCAAQGQFIAFLDADDMFSDGYLDKAADTLRDADEVGLVCSPASYVSESAVPLNVRAATTQGYYAAPDLVANRFLLQATMGREAVIRSQLFSPRYRGEDHQYFYRLTALGHLIKSSHETSVLHRCGGTGSITRSDIAQDVSERLEVMSALWGFEHSGRRLLARTRGERLLGLLYLAVWEGHEALADAVLDVARREPEGVMLLPPPSWKDMETTAAFFAAKQFGRDLQPLRNLRATVAVASRFLLVCHDFVRPAFFRHLRGWLTSRGADEALALLFDRFAEQASALRVDARPAAVPTHPLIDALRIGHGPDAWLTDGQAIEPVPVARLGSAAAIADALLCNAVVRASQKMICGSQVARSLRLSAPVRGAAARCDGNTLGGWRISKL